MILDRENFIDDHCGSIGSAMDMIDGLLSALDHYIASDECAVGNGAGCFSNPQEEVERVLSDLGLIDYISR